MKKIGTLSSILISIIFSSFIVLISSCTKPGPLVDVIVINKTQYQGMGNPPKVGDIVINARPGFVLKSNNEIDRGVIVNGRLPSKLDPPRIDRKRIKLYANLKYSVLAKVGIKYTYVSGVSKRHGTFKFNKDDIKFSEEFRVGKKGNTISVYNDRITIE